jgi:NAD(P)H-flavin reductase
LKVVREIAEKIGVPIIGCGGVSSADDVRAYRDAGASIFGVGSALTGLTTHEIGRYFEVLEDDLRCGANEAERLVRYDVDMRFRPVTLVENRKVAGDIRILTFDRTLEIRPGEFVFLWIPGVGEKPFSALTDDPFSLVVIEVGQFTEALMELPPGTEAYVRGPYGQPVRPPEGARIIAVAGGTGLAAVYQLVRDLGGGDIFMGARSAERLYFVEESEACADVHIATDDGSRGHHGLVTELLEQHLAGLPPERLDSLVFYNCGPEPMVHAAVAVERKFCREDRIFSAIDYLTKCGVGVCGACAAPDGRRLCVDGPFLQNSAGISASSGRTPRPPEHPA